MPRAPLPSQRIGIPGDRDYYTRYLLAYACREFCGSDRTVACCPSQVAWRGAFVASANPLSSPRWPKTGNYPVIYTTNFMTKPERLEGLPGRYWHRLEDGCIQCDICPRYCKLNEGQRALGLHSGPLANLTAGKTDTCVPKNLKIGPGSAKFG